MQENSGKAENGRKKIVAGNRAVCEEAEPGVVRN